ncbi:gamma-interferon-responsive lysosomal thiol protein-like [Hibiscus syriacus]|uniref:gamma-interferon-responsive lysosomal thiol protein-like n=1 Tax=Hibiscus syriacus TaxID=106335 RepID=UPI0019233C71|nr:gamma-interferon-responsive lysosomal thiol protein-like [Hibiscus syriacus]
MASSRLLSFLLLSLLVIFIYPSNSSPENNVTEAQSHIRFKKASLSLYYEALCPYCRSFIVSRLVKVFNTDLLNIINLRLVPWGNAEYVKTNKTIICQHGEDECYLNTIHACAINIWPDPRKHFNFIYCVENQGPDGTDAVWKTCSSTLGMDQKLIKNCYDSGYGRKLLLRYATETDDLHPKHSYVPWVTVNNQPLYDQYENFIAYVCNAYKDKSWVKACLSRSLNATEEKSAISKRSHNGGK